MCGWMCWLNQNSGAVMAMVTAVYALFTILLWWATSQQAALTRRILEASHRPYVNVLPQAPAFHDGHIHFVFHLENRGTVPAMVTRWQVSVRYRGQAVPIERGESRDVVRVVFPSGAQERLGLVRVVEPNGLRLPGRPGQVMLVEASVAYHGVGGRQFSTEVLMELFATSEVTAWDCREVRLDP